MTENKHPVTRERIFSETLLQDSSSGETHSFEDWIMMLLAAQEPEAISEGAVLCPRMPKEISVVIANILMYLNQGMFTLAVS